MYVVDLSAPVGRQTERERERANSPGLLYRIDTQRWLVYWRHSSRIIEAGGYRDGWQFHRSLPSWSPHIIREMVSDDIIFVMSDERRQSGRRSVD